MFILILLLNVAKMPQREAYYFSTSVAISKSCIVGVRWHYCYIPIITIIRLRNGFEYFL